MTLPLVDGITYGPVRSRRLGSSLGVNLLPRGAKICNMNCAYCQYGWTRRTDASRARSAEWPTASAVEAAVKMRLSCAALSNETIDRITVAGHGEPTLHPDFEDVVRRISRVRDRMAPAVPLAVLSNSTTARATRVRRGLAQFDERYMKLDAGDPFTFAAVNGIRPSLAGLIDALRGLAPIIVQAMFVGDSSGERDNTSDVAIDSWLAAVETVRAERVHIYTIDRPPALTRLRPVAAGRLREIAERVRRTGIPADVFSVSPRSSPSRLREI